MAQSSRLIIEEVGYVPRTTNTSAVCIGPDDEPKGNILQVVFVAALFGFSLSVVVNIWMRFAPIGAFRAMAFTVGRYGITSLGPRVKLIATFWMTSILFGLIGLGAIYLSPLPAAGGSQ